MEFPLQLREWVTAGPDYQNVRRTFALFRLCEQGFFIRALAADDG
ncbi:hypothetical protein [Novosphingobium sp. P6W]|nr:hypothetical protein [Novosphingobium sp. P6W]